MKNLVILYAGEVSEHVFEKVFDSKSAFERVIDWSEHFADKIIVFTSSKLSAYKQILSFSSNNSKIEIIEKDLWTKSVFISEISNQLSINSAENAIVSYADTPFLNEKLTKDLLEMHSKYAAEYSFADGFPYGLTPEIIEKGTVSILSELAKTNLKSEGEKLVDREAIFSVMKGDINSFEIETLISDEDYRLLRLCFETSDKLNFLSCTNLFEEAKNQNVDLDAAYALSNLASKTPSVLSTVPAFYNIQISSKYNHVYAYSLESIGKNPSPKDFMNIEDFKKILSDIKDFSENAVISLSAFGEPLLHPEILEFISEVINQNDQNHKISLLIETDGLLVTEELSQKISELSSQKNTEVNWIVYIDSVDENLYSQIHNCKTEDFIKAVSSINVLEKYFSHHVYPQFMRMKTNEHQLEAFYRFWSNAESPSNGNLIIQKYNSVCGALSDLKSADLSPVNRLPCWHLRRDMTILSDGTVPVCFQLSFSENAGNILKEGIGIVWKKIQSNIQNHISQKYTDNCSICDESYTFNF